MLMHIIMFEKKCFSEVDNASKTFTRRFVD